MVEFSSAVQGGVPTAKAGRGVLPRDRRHVTLVQCVDSCYTGNCFNAGTVAN